MGREWQRTRAAPARATHSWNGKYRRPDKLWTPDYRTPMQGNLLWVYEGQTSFWDLVLAARSGMQSTAMVLADWATNAGSYSVQPGRAWRAVAAPPRAPEMGREPGRASGLQ